MRLGGLASLKVLPEGEITLPTHVETSGDAGEATMGARSYVLAECAVNVAAITGDAGKWTCGESFDDERTTEKLAANGKGFGDSGKGAGRLRIDLDEVGLMNARAGDFTPAIRIDWDVMYVVKGRKSRKEGFQI